MARPRFRGKNVMSKCDARRRGHFSEARTTRPPAANLEPAKVASFATFKTTELFQAFVVKPESDFKRIIGRPLMLGPEEGAALRDCSDHFENGVMSARVGMSVVGCTGA